MLSLGADFLCLVGGYFTEGGRRSSRYDRSFVYELARGPRFDGLVVAAGLLSNGVGTEYVRDFCAKLAPPVVAVGRVPGIPHVVADQETGMRTVLEHLILDHHRERFAFIRGCEGNPDAIEREAIFRKVLAQQGIRIREDLMLSGEYIEVSGALAVRELFDKRRISTREIDAIVAANDRMAIGAIQALSARGVAVPQEIAVVGFDDDENAGLSEPPLTTVSQPVEHIGQRAVEVLLARLLGEPATESVLVETVPVLRRSCGCVRRTYDGPKWRRAGTRGTWPLPDEFRMSCRQNVVRQFGLDECGSDRGSDSLVSAIEQALSGAELDLDPFTHAVLTTANDGDDPLRWREVLQLAEADMDRWECADRDPEMIERVRWALAQAHLVVAEIAARAQRQEQLRSMLVSGALKVLDSALVSAQDEDAFANILRSALPALGFRFCCVCLFEDTLPERSHSRAIAVIDPTRPPSQNPTPNEGPWWGESAHAMFRFDAVVSDPPTALEAFPTEDLFPTGMRTDNMPPFLSVHPLIFGRKPLGYAVFDQPWRYGQTWVSSALVESLSSAVSVLQQAQLLWNARRAAEAASAAKSDFVARMSHEIRTPLTAIMGYLDLCVGEATTPNMRRYLAQAQASSKVLLGVINDVLDFSKIEASRLEVERTTFRLDDVLDQITATTAGAAFRKDVELVVDVAENLPGAFLGDPLRLIQVLVNLLSNAIKFTTQGEVVLTIDRVADAGTEARVRFSVRDTGIGIAPEHILKLMVPFVQADSSTTRRYGGTGLGLAISQRLIGRMGGTLTMKSELGKGTECSFSLPLTDASESRDSVAAGNWSSANVILVDDNRTSLELIRRMLVHGGCSVSVAENGEAAIAMVESARSKQERIDVMILDQRLPGLTGCDVVQALVSRSLLGDCRVLIMEPFGEADPSLVLPQATVLWGCLSKPVRRTELADRLRCVTKKSGTTEMPRSSRLQDLRQPLAGKRVLLVQDDEVNRLLAKEVLEGAGMLVDAVETGLDAVSRFAEAKPDAVLMDLDLPDIDGCEATRRIRESAGEAFVPVIAVTASVIPEDRERCLKSGMIDCLQTPVNSAHMFEVIAKWLAPASHAPPAKASPCGNSPKAEAVGGSGKAPVVSEPLDVRGALSRLGGDAALYRRLLRTFLDTHGATAHKYQGDLTSEGCLRAVHTLSSAAANIGALELHRTASILERELRTGQVDAPAAWSDFERALGQTMPSIAAASLESVPPPANSDAVDTDGLCAHLEALRELLDRCDLGSQHGRRGVEQRRVRAPAGGRPKACAAHGRSREPREGRIPRAHVPRNSNTAHRGHGIPRPLYEQSLRARRTTILGACACVFQGVARCAQ